jgi:hypothetical protein
MKRLCAGLIVLLCSVSLHAQKTRMAQELPYAKPGMDYPMVVHVYGVHIRADCSLGHWEGQCADVLFADITSNGRKLELVSSDAIPEDPYNKTKLLSFGDVHARVLKNAPGTELGDEYEFLLPNRRVLKCVVVGMTE